ncbi:MAG: hypothetical protein GY711_23730 [bacterium]|nr:hypothetical protein [bacterium]
MPSSLQLVTRGSWTTFGGHAWDYVSCCDDAVVRGPRRLLMLDCSNGVVELQEENGQLRATGSWPTAIEDDTSPELTEREQLAVRDTALWAAPSTTVDSDSRPFRMRIWSFDLVSETEELELEGVIAEDLAVGTEAILLVVHRDDGGRMAVRLHQGTN